jgi:DNA replication initiation complex subunit (GINS family)
MAKFNIDLLVMLQDKTKNNLLDEEKKFLDSLVTDLQMKYIQMK